MGGGGGQEAIGRLQITFANLFSYLTDKKETIFMGLYERKLKKRVVQLMRIEDRLTHFYKIVFNPDYAELHTTTSPQQQPNISRL